MYLALGGSLCALGLVQGVSVWRVAVGQGGQSRRVSVQSEKEKWSLAMIKFKREEMGFIRAGFFIVIKETVPMVSSASLAARAESSSRHRFCLSPVCHQVRYWEIGFLPEPSYSHPTAANPGAGCLGSSLLFRISKSPG